MKKIVTLLVLVFTLSTFNAEAQRYPNESEVQLFFGLNTIANTGSKNPAESMDEWAFNSFPVTIGLVYKWNELFGVTHSYSFNKFNNEIDGVTASEKFNYFAIDTGVNYYFGNYFINNADIDLYATSGLGLFKINKVNGSFNFGGGLTYWVSDTVGISGQGLGKFAFDHKNEIYDTNHFQYNFKVLFRL